jgi:hypothetical protein
MYLSVDIPGETAMRHLAIIKMKCEQCDLRAARTVRGLGPSSSTFKWIAPFALALGNATWRHDGDSRLEPPHRDIVNETLAATTNHIPMAHTREAHMKRTDAKPLEISCRASKAKAVFGAGTFNDWQPDATPLRSDRPGGHAAAAAGTPRIQLRGRRAMMLRTGLRARKSGLSQMHAERVRDHEPRMEVS